MAIYTDPRTGQQRRTDDLGRTSYSSSWGIVLVLILAVALAWAFYGRPSVDHTNTGASTTTEPVTTPSSPNASPTHPAPSPNPGP
jgi:hypothetical protein